MPEQRLARTRKAYTDATRPAEAVESWTWCVTCRAVTPTDGLGCRPCRQAQRWAEPSADTPWGV